MELRRIYNNVVYSMIWSPVSCIANSFNFLSQSSVLFFIWIFSHLVCFLLKALFKVGFFINGNIFPVCKAKIISKRRCSLLVEWTGIALGAFQCIYEHAMGAFENERTKSEDMHARGLDGTYHCQLPVLIWISWLPATAKKHQCNKWENSFCALLIKVFCESN